MKIQPNLLRRGAIATLAVGLLGLAIAHTMPRGPATAFQAVIVIIASLMVGYSAGWILRSPWAMGLAPLTYILAIEVGRFPIIGPTVDELRLNETFGILALILGRGFHGLVGVLPMILGAYWGWVIVRSGASHQIPLIQTICTSNKYAIGATLGFSILALLILLPATTPAILNANGKPLSGSIARLEKVRLGGHEQWIMLRGHSTDKPVLLYLSGGPGQSDLPFVRVLLHDLTQNFVVVGWDQRGTGKSYSALDPTETLTLDRAVSDTIELTNYLRVVTHNSGLGGLQHYLTRLRLWRCPVEWYCKTLLKLSGGSILLPALFHFQVNNPLCPDAQPYDTFLFVVAAVLIAWFNRKAMFGKAAVTDVIFPSHRSKPMIIVDSNVWIDYFF